MPDERVTVPEHLLGRSGDHYVLRVVGDGQIGEAIRDGDFIVVRRTEVAADGDFAVCLIGDSISLKRVYREGDVLRLESWAEQAVVPLRLPAAEVTIQGVVTGQMRKYP